MLNGFVIPGGDSMASMAGQLAQTAREEQGVVRALVASQARPGAPVQYEEDEEALLAVAMEVGLSIAFLWWARGPVAGCSQLGMACLLGKCGMARKGSGLGNSMTERALTATCQPCREYPASSQPAQGTSIQRQHRAPMLPGSLRSVLSHQSGQAVCPGITTP